MRRIAQISVLGLAALAVWLLIPSADERSPVREREAPVADRSASPAVPELGLEARTPEVAAGVPVSPVEVAARGSVSGPGGAGDPGLAREADELAADSPEAALFQARAERALRRGAETAPSARADSAADDDVDWGEEPVAAPRTVSRISMAERSAPDAALVDQLVENELPDGSLPPAELEQAREDARERITEEQVLLDELARRSAGEGATEQEIRDRRNLAQTLLSAQDRDTQERVYQRAADEINTRE